MINIKFTADPLPTDFSGTLQDFQDRFLLNLRGSIDETQVLTGQIGGPPPTQDVGPWLNGTTWHIWNGSEYVPSMVKIGGAGYVVQLGDYTTSGDGASLLPDRFQTLQDKDGTVALLSDIYAGRPTIVLSGATPTIDWSLSNNFTQVLPSNITVSMKNSQPGQEVVVTLKNNATSYTVTWAATPAIFWPAGTPPSQTASKTDMYILKNIGGSILGRQVANY
jgi:hypothetical protein